MNRNQMKSTLFEALQKSGEILKRSLLDRKVVEKKSELSLVTATDKASEKAILETLYQTFPDHAVLTEESPPRGNSDYRWIIDPLDGTTNFAHTYPVACISIGLEHKGEIIMGGVLDPFRDELFFAERGGGATLNGKPIETSKIRTLSESLFCTGFPYDRRERPDQYLAIFKEFMIRGHGMRRTGAAALDLCYIACGRFDGFWEFQLQPWDKAAGMIIIEEAKGRVSNYRGEPLTLTDGQNLASNGLIHEEMIAVLDPFKHLQK